MNRPHDAIKTSMNMVQSASLRVPYAMSVHGEEEISAVLDVLRTTTQMGRHVKEFESKIAQLFSKRHGIMVNSGSSALQLALEAPSLPVGSEVITPCLTFATTVAAILKNGLVPVFIDVEPGTYCINASKVKEAINENTSAIVAPDLMGNLPDWPALSALAKKHNLLVVEDSADTLGATLNGKSSGAYSDISITSFYGSHIINCAGNGGMLCVNDDEHDRRARLLRSWGRSSSLFNDSEAIENRFNVEVDGIPYDTKFLFEAIGYNYEPSELGAAYGLVQLGRLQKNMEARAHHYSVLREFFSKYSEWFILPEQRAGSNTAWLAFPLTIRENAPFDRRSFQIFFEKRNIQTRVVFTGNVLRQPGFRNIPRVVDTDGYPVADEVMRGGVLMGCHHGMTPEMLAHIKDTFVEFTKTL